MLLKYFQLGPRNQLNIITTKTDISVNDGIWKLISRVMKNLRITAQLKSYFNVISAVISRDLMSMKTILKSRHFID